MVVHNIATKIRIYQMLKVFKIVIRVVTMTKNASILLFHLKIMIANFIRNRNKDKYVLDILYMI